ncbi:MAG: hypothetical protein IKQ84_00305 [Spirochaetaceae bacterium]|nr:hypothetical protein [Spirochaetaceae bacterium]
MKKTIGILILAVILVFSLTSCGGGGGGSNAITDAINKITGKNNNASKNNFAGRTFGDFGMWAGDASKATIFQFGASDTNTVTVQLEGVNKGSCTYNKPTGLSNVNLIIKDSSNTEIVNWTVDFADDGHSFNLMNKANTQRVTFSMP